MKIKHKENGFAPLEKATDLNPVRRDSLSNGVRGRSSLSGFTLIELIMTILVLGLIMVPLGIMSIEYMRSIVYSRDLVVAEGLAKTEMSKINNLDYGDNTLEDGDDDTTSSYEGYHLDLNRKVDYVPDTDNNLKKVEVSVYESGTTIQLVKLVSYIADVSFGSGSGGGEAVVGGMSASLAVSGGNISGANLENVTLQNTSGDPITIDGVIISFTGAGGMGGGIHLQAITMDGAERWSGPPNAASGSSIVFDTNFTLAASTTYNNTGLFVFIRNLTSVTSLVFIMSDGSETDSYSW